MSLDEILDELSHESTPVPKRQLQEEPLPEFTDADKQISLSLPLSRYELHWLHWRLVVHLRSYEALEWSEMKEVLQCLVKRTSSILTSANSSKAGESTPAEGDSKPQPCTESSCPSPASSVETSSPSQKMEDCKTEKEIPLTLDQIQL